MLRQSNIHKVEPGRKANRLIGRTIEGREIDREKQKKRKQENKRTKNRTVDFRYEVQIDKIIKETMSSI